MAIDIDTLHSGLEALGLTPRIPEEPERAGFVRTMYLTTRNYRDQDGDMALFVVAELPDEGRYLHLYAPEAFNVRECRHKAAVFSVAMHIAFCTRFVQCEYDPADGELRFAVDMPICDGTVTNTQLEVLLSALVDIVDTYTPVLLLAMETGKIDFSLIEQDEEEPSVSEELAELLQAIGGIDALREIAARRLAEENGQ
jgi:hypothetical protein